MKHLKDGRPINEDVRKTTLESISEIGVTAENLLDLMEVFTASDSECQVALNITDTKWQNILKTGDMIKDVGICILVTLYLKNPDRWPVRYTKDADLNKLSEELGKTIVPMIVGRSTHSIYRWKPPYELPKDHVKILLAFIEESINNNDEKQLHQYMEIVENEAKRRGINFRRDTSWVKK